MTYSLCAQHGNNNPVKFSDPSGRFSEDEIKKYMGVETWDEVVAQFEKGGKYEGQWGWLEVLRYAHAGDLVTFSRSDRLARDPRDPDLTYRGTFTENDNGDLRLQDAQGTMYDPLTILNSFPHDTMDLYQRAPPGATIRYDNSYLGGFHAGQQYLHVKAIRWDTAVNPFVWGEYLDWTKGFVTAGAMTALMVAAIGPSCTIPATCAIGAAVFGPAAVGGFGATLMIGATGYERLRKLWTDEIAVLGP